ncbi:MAG: ABC transporter permease [Steroidobacteraceae bacterium]
MVKHYLQTALRNLWSFKFTTLANVFCLAFGFACFMCAYVVASWLTQSDPRFVNANRTYAIGNGSLALYDQLKTDYKNISMTAYFVPDLQVDASSDGINKSSVTTLVTDSDFFNLYRLTVVSGSMALTGSNDVLIGITLSKNLFGNENAVGKQLLLGSGVAAKVVGVYEDLSEPSALSIQSMSRIGANKAQSLPQVVLLNALAERLGMDNQMIPIESLRAEPVDSNWLEGRIIYFSIPTGSGLTAQQIDDRSRDYLQKFSASSNPDTNLLSVNQLVARERRGIVSQQVNLGSPATILMMIGIVVVCVAIANYANLYTTQTVARTKDNGLRQLLGATRTQMLCHCLLDVFLLCIVAMLMALALLPLCKWALGLSEFGFDLARRMQLDWRVFIDARFLLVSLALLMMATLLSAIYPVYLLGKVRPMDVMRSTSLTHSGLFARLLVGMQFMTASALLIGLLVMQWQYREFQRVALGSQGDQLVILNNPVLNGVPSVTARPRPVDAAFNTVKTELLRHKEVLAVAWVQAKLWGTGRAMFDARKEIDSEALIPFNNLLVSDNFPSMMGFKLLAGRWLDIERDTKIPPEFLKRRPVDANGVFTPPVSNVLVDVSLIDKLGWPDADQAIGKQFLGRSTLSIMAGPAGVAMGNRVPSTPYRIVGVVEGPPLTTSGIDTKLFQLAATSSNMIGIRSPLYAVIQIDKQNIPGGIAAIAATIKKLAPDVAANLSFADQVFSEAFARYQLLTNAVTVLASIAFAISIMSMVGMAAHVLNRRRHEVGIRKSLGASTLQIFRMLLSDFSKPVVLANIMVWPLAYIVMNAYLGIFTYRISLNAWPFVISLLITVSIACLAVLVQTRRVARLVPSEVLRYE